MGRRWRATDEVAGRWALDLISGVTWRDEAHDMAFGYGVLEGPWCFERFVEHVASKDRDGVLRGYEDAARSGAPWNFRCDVLGADGAERRIAVRGMFSAGTPGSPPQYRGTVLRVATTEALVAELEDVLAELRGRGERSARADSEVVDEDDEVAREMALTRLLALCEATRG